MNKSRFLQQGSDEKCCGHYCLAMVKNISIEDSVKLIGHEGGTTTKELTTLIFGQPRKLKIGFPEKRSLCMVRFSEMGYKSGHWVIYDDGEVYDPIVGYFIPYEEWEKIKAGINGVWNKMRITSHVELWKLKLKEKYS